MAEPRRVVVTGLGLVTPLGIDRESSWSALLSGNSGVCKGRAESTLEKTQMPRPIQLALTAAREAVRDSGHSWPFLNERWGCCVSCSKPIFLENSQGVDSRDTNAGDSAVPGKVLWPDVVPSAVAREFGVEGPVINFASACATGLQSVMAAAEWVREGRCDAVLAGASESSLHPLYLSGFSQMGVLSDRGAVAPFDRGRDGFVVGEGASVLVVEDMESAHRRHAPIYGELLGWDFSCDASHATRFNSQGERIVASLQRTLRRAGLVPERINYVNAHGTATLLNDDLEATALAAVFHDKASTRISSTKGATGHLLGATGAVELGFCLLALRDRTMPQNLNLRNPLTDRLNFVVGKPQPLGSGHVATLSFGFGGSLASLIAGPSSS